MDKNIFRVLLLIALLHGLVFVSSTHAGTISITSAVDAKEVDGKIALQVKVGNEGDEAAKSVQVHLELAGDKITGPKWESIEPKRHETYTFIPEKLPTHPGTYPVFITIEFADLNMYPFTALNVSAFQVGRDTGQAQLFAKSEPIVIGKSGTLTATLKNLDEKAKSVTARVLGPRELDIKPMLFDFEIAPNSTMERSIDVANFSALPGAAYPIFVIFEYDLGDVHYSHPLVTRVTIGQGGLTKNARAAIILAGAFLLVLVVGFEVFRRVRKTKKA